MMSIATRAADRRLARLPCNLRLLTRRGALAIAMSVGACVVPGTSTDAAQRTLDQATLVWMQAVLSNWEAVCRRDLRIAAEPLPWDHLLR